MFATTFWQSTHKRSGQPEEETIQEANHSDDNLHVNQGEDEHIDHLTEIKHLKEGKEINLTEPTVRREMLEPRKEKIKWPTSADKVIWKAFGEELENILKATLAGNVDRKLRAMTSIIYSVGKNRFGLITSEKREKTQDQSNRRQIDQRTESGPQKVKEEELKELFDESELKFKEVQDVLMIARAASAPGPNGIQYRKRGMQEVSRCIEHTSVLIQILRKVKKKKSDLAVLWLDRANAYGSIPHKLRQDLDSVIVGVTAVGRQGFGMTTKPRWDTADEKRKKDWVLQEVRKIKREQEYQGGRHETASQLV
ncbi:unnamed protein product [Mytilus coruscus]|uniref:Reverse transcriptase domain-containing protein n=1 Tax=Mytilus coruscus TaxID=42192 RepID=A0A6J8EU50_MYTCO|nr:unnamed protein product [Mytilus coruscus]